MKKAVRLRIKGTVQGVFFRAFVKEHADKMGLKGFVRNLENGDVEVFIEGNIDDVDKLIEICKKGPKHAIIKEVKVREVGFQDYEDFRILRI